MCVNCKIFCCDRPSCSVAKVDEDTDGWVENVSVAYCSSCFLALPSLALNSHDTVKSINNDLDEDDDEVTKTKTKTNKQKQKKGNKKHLEEGCGPQNILTIWLT